MKVRALILALLCTAGILCSMFIGARRAAATQAVFTPSPEQVRFQLIGNEPIAGPDGLTLVKDWSVLMFKDRKTGECYVAFSRGSAIAAANVAACSPSPR